MRILQYLQLQYIQNPVLKKNLKPDLPIISLINGGGIRGSISQGNITTRQIMAVFPFGNNLVVVTMSGKDIKKMLTQKYLKSSLLVSSIYFSCGNDYMRRFLVLKFSFVNKAGNILICSSLFIGFVNKKTILLFDYVKSLYQSTGPNR